MQQTRRQRFNKRFFEPKGPDLEDRIPYDPNLVAGEPISRIILTIPPCFLLVLVNLCCSLLSIVIFPILFLAFYAVLVTLLVSPLLGLFFAVIATFIAFGIYSCLCMVPNMLFVSSLLTLWAPRSSKQTVFILRLCHIATVIVQTMIFAAITVSSTFNLAYLIGYCGDMWCTQDFLGFPMEWYEAFRIVEALVMGSLLLLHLLVLTISAVEIVRLYFILRSEIEDKPVKPDELTDV